MPSIHTTRYSKVVRAFVERYPDAEVTLDKKQILVGEALWCKNAVLLNAIDFSICRGKNLAEKLKAYDPALHGGEISEGGAVGAEFGAKA